MNWHEAVTVAVLVGSTVIGALVGVWIVERVLAVLAAIGRALRYLWRAKEDR